MIFRSIGLGRAFGILDDYILELEEGVKSLDKKVEKLEKENLQLINNNYQKSMNISSNAILDEPRLDPLSATILMKIRNMDSIEDIHNYIKKVIEKIN